MDPMECATSRLLKESNFKTSPNSKKIIKKSCSSPTSPNSKENINNNKSQSEEKSPNSEQKTLGKSEYSLNENCINTTDSKQLANNVNKHVEGTETLFKESEVPLSDQTKLASLPDIVNVQPKSINKSEGDLNDTAEVLIIGLNKCRLDSSTNNDTQFLTEPMCTHEGVSSDEETFLECQTTHSSQISLNESGYQICGSNSGKSTLKTQGKDDIEQNQELPLISISPQPATTMLENIEDTNSKDYNLHSLSSSSSVAITITTTNESNESNNENQTQNVENQNFISTVHEDLSKENNDSMENISFEHSSDTLTEEKEKSISTTQEEVEIKSVTNEKELTINSQDCLLSSNNVDEKSILQDEIEASGKLETITQNSIIVEPNEELISINDGNKAQIIPEITIDVAQSSQSEIDFMNTSANSFNPTETPSPKSNASLLSSSNVDENSMSKKLEDDHEVTQVLVKKDSNDMQNPESDFICESPAKKNDDHDITQILINNDANDMQSQQSDFNFATIDIKHDNVEETSNNETFNSSSCTPMDVDESSFTKQTTVDENLSMSLKHPLDVLRDFFKDIGPYCCHCLLTRLGFTLCKNPKSQQSEFVSCDNEDKDDVENQDKDKEENKKEYNEDNEIVEIEIGVEDKDSLRAIFGYDPDCASCTKMLLDLSLCKNRNDECEILHPEKERRSKRSHRQYSGTLKNTKEIRKIIFTGLGLDSLPLTDSNWIFNAVNPITERDEQIRRAFLLDFLNYFDDAILKIKNQLKQKSLINDPTNTSPVYLKEHKQQENKENCIFETTTDINPTKLCAPEKTLPSPLTAEDELFFLESEQQVRSSIFSLGTETRSVKGDIKKEIENTSVELISNAKMSADVIKDMKINEDIKSFDIKSDEKKTNNMNEMEKEMKIENVKTEEVERKLKEAEQKEEELLKRITLKDKTITKMSHVIEAYEKAIAELIAEKEQAIQNYEKHLEEVKAERDLNYQHLTSLESTFTDLHAKYERSKQITMKLKTNEEELTAERAQCLENLRLQELRYEKMKNHAMQQLELANDKIEKLTNAHSLEVARLTALLKKEQVGRKAVSDKYEQKCRENEELMKICDELINGHTGGSSSSS